MLRNRSRAVTAMTDHGSRTSPTQTRTRPISPFFDSPSLFRNLSSKYPSHTESVVSPTSILDIKLSPVPGNPFWYDRNQSNSPEFFPGSKRSWEKLDTRGIGLALVDSVSDEKTQDNSSEPKSRMVLFGSQLKVQIPSIPTSALSPTESPNSPGDFGIKTRNSQMGSLSPFGLANSRTQTEDSAGVGCLSVSQMELSEDYTCVISHGPNPRTTHIFDNCIVGSCCGEVALPSLSKEHHSFSQNLKSPLQSFLSFCHTCKKNLGREKDIYMYRGDRAFCSRECRYQEMLVDGVENPELDDAIRTCS